MMTERKLQTRREREQEQPLESKYKSLGMRHVVGTLKPAQRQQVAGKAADEGAGKDRSSKQQR